MHPHFQLILLSLMPFASLACADKHSGDRPINRTSIDENYNPRFRNESGLLSGDRAVTRDVISVTPSGMSQRE